MMNKLIVLVLAFAIVAPALADDRIEAPFRGTPGSTYQEWTYNDPCGVYDWDSPENSGFVTGLYNMDGVTPAGDPCAYGDPAISMQGWGYNGDPCAPDWTGPGLPGGRYGAVMMLYASWDLNNFFDDLPAKDVWVQITYFNGTGEGSIDWAEVGYPDDDPCFVSEPWGWTEDPCSYEAPLSEWDWPTPPMETWWSEPEAYIFPEIVSSELLEDGWIHEVLAGTLPTNPDWEYFAMGFVDIALVDQIIIETISYIPEPATMVLLGLGSLMMIRRKKR